MSALPGLDLLNALQWDTNIDQIFATQKTDSQKLSLFTPLASQNSSGGRGNISINLPDESSYGSYRLPSDLGRNSPAGWKPNYQPEFEAPLMQHDQDLVGDLGFEFDEEGNLIDLDNGPALPALPDRNDWDAPKVPGQQVDAESQVQVPQQDEEQGVLIMEEQPLPDAEAFPSRKDGMHNHSSTTRESETTTTDRAAAAKLRQKARMKKMKAMVDSNPQLSRHEMKEWQNDYTDRMDALRTQPKTTSAAEARQNAPHYLYVGGVASVGFPFAPGFEGFAHPLAEDFAGKLFKARLLEREIEDDEETTPKRRRRRRRDHSEAFAED